MRTSIWKANAGSLWFRNRIDWSLRRANKFACIRGLVSFITLFLAKVNTFEFHGREKNIYTFLRARACTLTHTYSFTRIYILLLVIRLVSLLLFRNVHIINCIDKQMTALAFFLLVPFPFSPFPFPFLTCSGISVHCRSRFRSVSYYWALLEMRIIVRFYDCLGHR